MSGRAPGALPGPLVGTDWLAPRLGAPGLVVRVTACILALGAELAGYDDLAVYDGSWSEWGLPRADRPVVTGPQSGGPSA